MGTLFETGGFLLSLGHPFPRYGGTGRRHLAEWDPPSQERLGRVCPRQTKSIIGTKFYRLLPHRAAWGRVAWRLGPRPQPRRTVCRMIVAFSRWDSARLPFWSVTGTSTRAIPSGPP